MTRKKSGLQISVAAAAAKSLQSCPTLCDPMDGSPPGSPIHGILQARTLEWIAISFSNAWKWKVKVKSHSCVRLLVTPWTAAHRAPPSMWFSRQEYWSGLPFLLQISKTLQMCVFKGSTSGWRKVKSKPLWGTISCQSEWLRSKSLQAINAGEGVEKREPSYTVGGNVN